MSKSNNFEDIEIKNVIEAIVKWKNEQPGVLAQIVGYASFPIAWLVKKMIPVSAIQGVLESFDWVAKNTTTPPGSSDHDDFKSCNKYADQVINFHIGVAAAEGGAAGFFGLPAMVVDVPAVILLAMRLVRQIGCEYGYSSDSEEERKFAFSILAAASANTQEEKVVAMATNAYLITLLSKNTWKTIAQKAAAQPIGGAAAVIGMKELAKQLGINITKRSALAAIPVIGAAVGASANGWFIRDVGIAAQFMYQARWLEDHGFCLENDEFVDDAERKPTQTPDMMRPFGGAEPA